VDEKRIDLASLDTRAACDKGAEIELTHPITSEPLGVFISVVGKDSTAFREYMRDKINAMLRQEAMAKKRGKDVPPRMMEDSEAETVELLTVCTQGWRNVVLDGVDLPFSVQNAKKLYAEQLWVRKQVDDAIANLENFMKA
jgi:hypothetical protein